MTKQARSRWLRYAPWIICALPVMSLADDNNPGDGRPPAPARNDRNSIPDGINSPREGFRFRRMPAPDDEEWKQDEQWMEDHAPKRWEFYQKVPAGPRKDWFRRAIVRRIRNLDRIKAQSPAIYDLRVKRVQLEDDAFGIQQDIKAAGNGDKEKLKADLKAKISELFDNAVAERRERIDELQKFLEKQREVMKNDVSQRQQLVQADYERFLETGNLEFRNSKEALPDESEVPPHPASTPAED